MKKNNLFGFDHFHLELGESLFQFHIRSRSHYDAEISQYYNKLIHETKELLTNFDHFINSDLKNIFLSTSMHTQITSTVHLYNLDFVKCEVYIQMP